MIWIILDRSIKILYYFVNDVTSMMYSERRKMRYVIFVMNRWAPTQQRFRVEKVGTESAWELMQKRRISSFTDFFFFAHSQLESEEDVLNSMKIVGDDIEFRNIEMEKKRIYLLGHEFENYGTVFNPLTGASYDKRSFDPYKIVVIENV